jgi:uncharacterized membrane protein YedE/YeeE
MTTQLRGFGIEEPAFEQAMHAFSGGFMHLGHACGLLTGAVLAAGFVARARFDDDRSRAGAALHAAILLAGAYPELAGSVDCLQITNVPLTRLSGRLRYLGEGKGRICGRLHAEWAPRARQLIDEALEEFRQRAPADECENCAVRALRGTESSVRMKAGDPVVVAGLAGGVGLLGNVCGALGAGVFAISAGRYLSQGRQKRDPRIRRSLEELAGAAYRGDPARLRRAFIGQFGSDLCIDIVGRRFRDAADHSRFVERGGCESVATFVGEWLAENAACDRSDA